MLSKEKPIRLFIQIARELTSDYWMKILLKIYYLKSALSKRNFCFDIPNISKISEIIRKTSDNVHKSSASIECLTLEDVFERVRETVGDVRKCSDL